MDSRFYIPREMSMRLVLLGFTWACVREWAQYAKKDQMLAPLRYADDYSYLKEEYTYFKLSEKRKHFVDGVPLKLIFKWHRMPAITWDQAETWLHEICGVDFIKRPEAGAEKRYLCDVVIPGMGHQQLVSMETMRQAQEQAIKFAIENVKELPTIPAPTEEELEQRQLERDEKNRKEKEAIIAALPKGFVLIEHHHNTHADYTNIRYEYKLGSYVGIPKVPEDVIIKESEQEPVEEENESN